MIVLKNMKWSNAFSYGTDNSINFNSNELIQLIGKNGNGKSTIALILEEVLYNKNSKNIKKADIINRHNNSKKYTIELSFSKDSDEYRIITIRGTTQSVQLFKNNEDISAHTSTSTYKLIEEIIGFDHKTFTQIVYQSSAYSLEFLTATDTNRKKFLIDLLNLSIYTRASELFKEISKEYTTELEVAKTKIKTVNDWLIKFGKENLTPKSLIIVPNTPTDKINTVVELKEQLRTIETTNKKIAQNNKYKEILYSIDITPVNKPVEDVEKLINLTIGLTHRIGILNKEIVVVNTTCSSCGQPIDASAQLLLVEAAKLEREQAVEYLNGLRQELPVHEAARTRYNTYIKNQIEWERYHTLFDPTMSNVLLDRGDMEKELAKLESSIKEDNEFIAAVQKTNNDISAHNARIEVILGQIDTMKVDLVKYTTILNDIQYKLTNIQILVKTFSTTGLVAYKIECLVKDLEEITNEYLLDLSDGRFQLSFKVNSSDKLNVVINDNSQDIDILALSNGERARVNIATLLAIRKLMQTLSNSRINLLILDETVESLDIDGKERLIEILLKEEHLNTVLVSHSFTHPLIEKVHIIKENNISRIE